MSLLKYAAVAIVALSASPAVAGDPYAAGPDVLAAYKAYSVALNQGDAEAAAAAFAEKTYMVAGMTCTPNSPCLDREAVKANIEGWVGIRLKDRQVTEPQVLANMLVSRVEVVWDGIADMGIERIVGTDFVEAENGLLIRKIFIPDRNDEQTKNFLKIIADSQ
ncbi:hypothetical protein EJ066_16570 [Mesorhizobium sp. M9A.F.Ca.ET.002.03.1.2]|uniref:hypothetical protein n=1 Tax=Mesorhizobium sp. M9A.F.Ca.ET.002.03.1.2 TaxID=2493668 RepID=UPI000F751481|nr:hypothetical protein [Mesorhizobium sp. M9A.F.Ca.ET.002.03.1.2]AZN98647.1 hypothetical protein EJ066_16570 [Mesorhizobium sp. M9A.F.Ca.ET.002.03.1.2]